MLYPLPANGWHELWLSKGLDPLPVEGTPLYEIDGVQGFLTPADMSAIWHIANSLPRGGMYLEVGSWTGLSSILAANCLIANLNFDAKIFCVDTWSGSEEHQDYDEVKKDELFDRFWNNIVKARVEHFVIPVRGESLHCSRSFPAKFFDVVFIDGDHSYEGCLTDLYAWAPKLKSSGRLVGHDAIEDGKDPSNGVRKALDDFCQAKCASYNFLPPAEANFFWEIHFK